MLKPTPPHRGQAGVMLLEALIAILVFSFGILAIVGLQASAIKSTSDAKFRADAAFLANQILGVIWSDDRANLAGYSHRAALVPDSSNPCGAGAGVASTNANVISWLGTASAAGTVNYFLPSAEAQIVTDAATGLVTVRLCWRQKATDEGGNAVTPSVFTTVAQVQG